MARSSFVELFGEIVDTIRAEGEDSPYYMYGHAKEIANRLDLKNRDQVDKFNKFPLIWLMTDIEETSGEYKNVLYEVGDFKVFIVNSTKPTYTSIERTDNNFNPILQPIYEALTEAINTNRAIVTNSNGTQNEKINRYAWGSQSVYGNDALIFNEWLDAMEVTFTDIQVYKEVNQCQ